MHIFGYVAIGFLIVCMLLAATKALSVDKSPASMVIAGADIAPERLQEPAEEEEDLLNILD
jgi:hypothetical protein